MLRTATMRMAPLVRRTAVTTSRRTFATFYTNDHEYAKVRAVAPPAFCSAARNGPLAAVAASRERLGTATREDYIISFLWVLWGALVFVMVHAPTPRHRGSLHGLGCLTTLARVIAGGGYHGNVRDLRPCSVTDGRRGVCVASRSRRRVFSRVRLQPCAAM